MTDLNSDGSDPRYLNSQTTRPLNNRPAPGCVPNDQAPQNLEIRCANAACDFASELMGAKSFSDFVELSTAHARKQFETFTAHTKELAELAQKVATETVEPIKANASKLFKPAA
jgi:hypothetical protein